MPEAVSSAKILVKTPIIYYDKTTVQVAYQLRDAAGRSQVLLTWLKVELKLSSGSESTTSPCDVAGATTGLGLCTTTVPSSWFSEHGDVSGTAQVDVSYDSVSVATSSVSVFTLKVQPAFSELTAAGMVMTILQHPLVRGESFTVRIDANTNGQALDVWILEVAYDASILQYVSTTTSSLFKTAVVNSDTSAGTVTMTTGCLDSGVEAADATGSDVYVVTLTFSISEDADIDSYDQALSLYVSDMVNDPRPSPRRGDEVRRHRIVYGQDRTCEYCAAHGERGFKLDINLRGLRPRWYDRHTCVH